MRTALVIFILLFLGAVGLLIWQNRPKPTPPPVSSPVRPAVRPSRTDQTEKEKREAAQAVIAYLRAVYSVQDYLPAILDANPPAL